MEHQEHTLRRRVADDRGVALLVALAVVAILAVVIFDFSFSVRVDTHIATNFADRLVALEAAKAGANFGIYILRQDEPSRDNLRDEWAQLTGIVLSKTDPAELADQSGMTEEEIGQLKHEDFLAWEKAGNVPTASIVIIDEERKINVNLLSPQATGRGGPRVLVQGGERVREWIRTLIENVEFPDVDAHELVEAITDWVDPDDEGNAECFYYESLPEPYSCRNDRMESIYELKLVKGVTDLVFFGNKPYPLQLSGKEEDEWDERRKLGYTLPEVAPWEREEDPEAIYGLVNFLTAHSSGRVNFNTAPREVLRAILGNDDFLTDTIIQARQENPDDTRGIQSIILQASPPLFNILINGGLVGWQSTYFRIESTGKFHKAAVKVIAIVSRDNARDITIHSWRVENVRPESLSEEVALVNVM